MSFPNVPLAPGVPPLLRDPFAASAPVLLLVADAVSILGRFFGPQYGIFRNGIQVVASDNVISFDYKQSWRVSDYPLEQGAFESYNKVQTPFEPRVRFSAGGSSFNRRLLLDSIAAIAGDLNLYTAVTPEEIYEDVTIEHYDYSRTAQSAGLIVVDVWLRQVRVTTATQFANTKTPSAASAISGGQVQTATGDGITVRSLATGQTSGGRIVQ